MFSKKLIVLACAVLTGSFLAAQEELQEKEELKLTIEQAVECAIKGNISIKESEISLESAGRSKKYSWNSISPNIKATGSYSKSLPESVEIASTDGTVSLGANITFSFLPSLFGAVKTASLNYEKQEISYESACRTIELNVRKAFWALLLEQENINLQKNNMESAKKQYETNLSKYNRGALSNLDVLTAQVTYQNAELTYESAKTDWENDAASFLQLLGLDIDQKFYLEGSLEEILTLSEISSETTKDIKINSLEIKSLEKQIEAANASLLSSRLGSYAPSLSAGYSYSLSAKDSELSSITDNAKGTLSVGVSIPLDSFFPWSSNALTIESQKDSIAILQLEKENAETTLKVTVRNYLNQIAKSQENIKLRKSSISLAEQTYSMTLDAYNHGTRDLLSLQTASYNLLAAKVNLMSEANTLINAILDLENTLGMEFGTLGK